MVYFFFSSRRRHTRLQGGWSSDVCSSDRIDEAAFLVDADEQRRRRHLAHAVDQSAELLWARDVAAEDDHAARLHVVDQSARVGIKFRAWKSDEEELSDLLFAGK